PRQPRPRLSGRAIVAALGCLAVVAIAGAIALRPQPFRKPPEIVVSTPEPPKPAAEAAATPPPKAPATGQEAATATGPSIIRVNPDRPGSGNAIIVRDPSSLKQDLRVAHLPDRALIEQSEA